MAQNVGLRRDIVMSKLKVKLIRSAIKHPENQKRTLKALGLSKVNSIVEIEASAQVKGMLNTVHHLVKVTEM